MTYESLAQVFEAARSKGMSTAEALRAVDQVRAISPDTTAEIIRLRRREGLPIPTIAARTGAPVSIVRSLCRGTRSGQPDRTDTINDVLDAAFCVFGISYPRIKGTNRDGNVTGDAIPARRAVALVLRERVQPGLSYPQIAAALGRGDHTTAMSLVEKAKADPEAIKGAEAICARLGIGAAEGRAA